MVNHAVCLAEAPTDIAVWAMEILAPSVYQGIDIDEEDVSVCSITKCADCMK